MVLVVEVDFALCVGEVGRGETIEVGDDQLGEIEVVEVDLLRADLDHQTDAVAPIALCDFNKPNLQWKSVAAMRHCLS